MEKRRIGKSDLQVPPLCLGGNVFGWTIDQDQSFRVLDAAFDAGLTFIDTADVYSRWVPGHEGGESETILGQWMKDRGHRSKITLATKIGMDMGDDKKGLSQSYIIKGVEDSLLRLQTDFIDLYQSHKDDESTPVEETLGAYQKLFEQGKVRFIGASNFSTTRLSDSLNCSEDKKWIRYESLQPEYNLYERAGFEDGLQQLCVQKNVGVISYFSLAAGFLTGKYRSKDDAQKSARGGSVVNRYLNNRGFKILKALDDVSAQTKSNPTQVSLAWLMGRPALVAPIASATKVEQVQDLAAATQLKLGSDALALLDQASR